jgi:hypothetical protein
VIEHSNLVSAGLDTSRYTNSPPAADETKKIYPNHTCHSETDREADEGNEDDPDM